MKIKKLLFFKKKNSGRNNGKISVRHKGGEHKRYNRKIDFLRNKFDIPSTVKRFDYDPNRNVKLALLKYLDGEYRYIIKTDNMKINDKIISSFKKVNIKNGNSTCIKNLQVGNILNCIEKIPKLGAIYSRSMGSSSELIFKNKHFAIIKLTSFVKKKISLNCMATIGKIYNEIKKKLYKAGQNRWKGIRPTVRGVAMNPVDHPLGGGEGKTSGGRHPCSPTGIKSKGYKTKK